MAAKETPFATKEAAFATKEAGRVLTEHSVCTRKEASAGMRKRENGYWEADRQQGGPPKTVRR